MLLGLSAAYWGRYRFPMVRRGSRLDERLGLLNMVCVAGQGVVAIALAFSTNLAGIPLLAFTAGGLLLASVPLYFNKQRDLRLTGARSASRHVDGESQLRLMSRWPYTLAYTVGYVTLFAYILSVGFSAR